MFSQLERLQGIVARITYKPGWKILVSRGPAASIHKPPYCDQAYILVQWQAKDIQNPDKRIMLMRNMIYTEDDLERMNDKDILGYVIGGLIRGAELHEMDEWFKFDGQCIADPHPEIKNEVLSDNTNAAKR